VELEFQSTSDMQCGSWLLKELYVAVVVILAFFLFIGGAIIGAAVGDIIPRLAKMGEREGSTHGVLHLVIPQRV